MIAGLFGKTCAEAPPRALSPAEHIRFMALVTLRHRRRLTREQEIVALRHVELEFAAGYLDGTTNQGKALDVVQSLVERAEAEAKA